MAQHPPSRATVLRPKADDVLLTDGAYTEGKEHLGGFHDHHGARPRRRTRVGAEARGSDWSADRGAAVTRRPRGLIVGVASVPDVEVERVFREEYGRAVAVLVRVLGDIDIAIRLARLLSELRSLERQPEHGAARHPTVVAR